MLGGKPLSNGSPPGRIDEASQICIADHFDRLNQTENIFLENRDSRRFLCKPKMTRTVFAGRVIAFGKLGRNVYLPFFNGYGTTLASQFLYLAGC